MVHRRDKLRASMIMQERASDQSKIKMEWNHTLDEVLGNDKEGVTGVRLASTIGDGTRELPASGVFLAIGHTPNTDFLKGQVEMNEKGYIRWTETAPHRYQRGRRVRRRRRRRRLLPPGDHLRRHRLHGRPRCRTLAGGEGIH